MKHTPQNDADFLAALLEAVIDPADALTIVSAWVNGSRSEALALLNENEDDKGETD